LIKAEEMLAARLLSYHNVYFLIHLMKKIREAIQQDRFLSFSQQFYQHYKF